ncbi:MAG: universal stress protein [Lacisediminihabitans sp.]
MNDTTLTPVALPASEPAVDSAARQTHPRIVVGVDGSESSLAALRWGQRLSAALNLDIQVISVWQYPVMALGTFYPIEGWSPEEDTKQILAGVVQTVFGDTPPLSLSTLVRSGPAAPALIEESEGAEMLIVGSRGRGGFVGLLLGSVSSTVSEHAHCPVLVVHEAQDEPEPSAA